MTRDKWTAVDAYFEDALIPVDAALDAALAHQHDSGLPAIHVSPHLGKLLMLLATMSGARRILEIGTLGGYSTIWLARALPEGGRLITLELEPAHADVARANLVQAGVADRVDVRVGPALDSLHALEAGGEGPFDLVFIDADKQSLAVYFKAALALSRPGTTIIADNVVRDGAVADPTSDDERVRGVQALVNLLKDEPGVQATAIQTVGEKGYDGFILAVVQPVG
jgi:predicted O-methyltransferase YrrM